MKRIWTIAVCAVALCFLACKEKNGEKPKPKEKPNVLFVAIDDMNDWTGFLDGRKRMKTPNLDKLVSEGMLYTNAHCSATSYNPSIVSIMTRVRPSTSGVYDNWDFGANHLF